MHEKGLSIERPNKKLDKITGCDIKVFQILLFPSGW